MFQVTVTNWSTPSLGNLFLEKINTVLVSHALNRLLFIAKNID